MSNRIRASLGGGKRRRTGEAYKPFGQSTILTFIASAMVFFFSLTLLTGDAAAKSEAKPEGEDAVRAFLVKERGSSRFLREKNIDKRIAPASLTKIMTCMIAIESGRLNEVVTIPLVATQVEPTKAGFKPGDRVRLRDLVKAAMVHSSNDAAFAIAAHLGGGSQKRFVAKMNARARALGMRRTKFTNPSGYDHGPYAGNRSTARDLMKLTEYAVKNAEFNKIAKLDRVVFSELKTGKRYSLRSHNKLLDQYPYSVGIKTGYTSKAGPCLIARAVRDDKDMLVILLHSKTDRWELASSMFDSGFKSVARAKRPVQVASASVKAPESEAPDVVPAQVVYARRAEALKALRFKVARQTAEREAARKEASKRSGEKEVSLSSQPGFGSNG